MQELRVFQMLERYGGSRAYCQPVAQVDSYYAELEIIMILVSACLLGVNCRYDGLNNLNPNVLKYLRDKGSFIACCPELLGGLPIPRGPFEITGGTGREVIEGKAEVRSAKGKDTTKEFLKGARETLKIAEQNGIKLAILKARSPSCGVDQIYDGTFSGTLIKGDGVAAVLLREKGIELVSDEHIGGSQT